MSETVILLGRYFIAWGTCQVVYTVGLFTHFLGSAEYVTLQNILNPLFFAGGMVKIASLSFKKK